MESTTAITIIKIANLSSTTIEKLKIVRQLAQLKKDIKKILEKMDERILSDIASAYEALGDALQTGNEQVRKQSLSYVHDHLLKNTKLGQLGKTGGYPNSYLMALSYYGLALYCVLLNDELTASKHFLRIFKVDPRVGRENISPTFYKIFFEPQCIDIFEWYEERKDELYQKQFQFKIMRDGVLALLPGAIGSIGYAATGFRNANLFHQGSMKSQQMLNERKTVDYYREQELEKLVVILESKLDDRCRKIAESLISGEKKYLLDFYN